MKKNLLIVLFLWGSLLLFSQDYNTTKGIVKDSSTKEILPYATILVSGTNKGVISNRDGEFNISSNTDSISISYVGYRTKKVKLSPGNYNVIHLEKSISNLSEVTITSYTEKDLVNFVFKASRKRKKQKNNLNVTSKSFVKIYSTYDHKPIEFSEGFYNLVQNYKGVSKLKLKNGKYYCSKDNQDFFSINLLSQLIPNLNFFNLKNSIIGWLSPLNIKSKKDISKFYKLSSLGQVGPILSIQFQSKVNSLDRGELVLDVKTQKLVKLEIRKSLKNDNIFRSLNKDNQIENPRMEVRVDYNKDAQLYLMRVNIDYEYSMKNLAKHISTRIVARAYHFNKPFTDVYNLPETQNDYEKLKFVRENKLFWTTSSLISKTKQESNFVGQMEYNEDFQTSIIDKNFEINRRLISPKIPQKQMRYIRRRNGNIIARAKHNPYFYIDIKLLANIELMDNHIICDVYPVVDYSNSYSLLADKEKQEYLTDSLVNISLSYSKSLKKKVLTELTKSGFNKQTIQEIITNFQNSFSSISKALLTDQLSIEDTFEKEKNDAPMSSKEKLLKIINQ